MNHEPHGQPGPGEQHLTRTNRRLHRPGWLRARLVQLQEQENALRRSIGTLELQRAKHGLDTPMEIYHGLEEARDQLNDVLEERSTLLSGWERIASQAEYTALDVEP